MGGTQGKEKGAWGPWVNIETQVKASGTIRRKVQEEAMVKVTQGLRTGQWRERSPGAAPFFPMLTFSGMLNVITTPPTQTYTPVTDREEKAVSVACNGSPWGRLTVINKNDSLFTTRLSYTSHSDKCSPCITLSSPHSNLMRVLLLLSPFHL